MPFLKGEVKESPRKEFIYWTDDGDLMAIRYEEWKVGLQGSRSTEGVGVWQAPVHQAAPPETRTTCAADPFERGPTRIYYGDWMARPGLRPGPDAGLRRPVAGELQGVPAPAEARELQPRRGDGEADAGELRSAWHGEPAASGLPISRCFGGQGMERCGQGRDFGTALRPGAEARPARSVGLIFVALLLFVMPMAAGRALAQSDPLPSWNDGAAKAGDRRLRRARDHAGRRRTSCRPTERIATFDNDGTLWAEQPIYFQFAFAIDRVKALAPQHPEWKDHAAVQGGAGERHEGRWRRAARRACSRSWRRRMPA